MTRLEFVKLESVEELKKVINALVNKEEYKVSYSDKEGQVQRKTLCKNGRLYVGSNFSNSISVDDKGQVYIGVDYLSSDDRIQMNRNNPKVETTNVF